MTTNPYRSRHLSYRWVVRVSLGRLALAAISAYLVLAGLFFLVYLGTGDFDAHDRHEVAFFSLVTQATVGYGDITPTSAVSRAVAWLQILVGVTYVALIPSVVLARLLRRQVGRFGSAAEAGLRSAGAAVQIQVRESEPASYLPLIKASSTASQGRGPRLSRFFRAGQALPR